MNNDETNEFSVVAANPEDFYRSPADVLDDPALTHEEKLRLLGEWEADITSRLGADSEGMAQSPMPADRGRAADDAALLKQVATSRRRANELKDWATGGTMLGRVWRRLVKGTSAAVAGQRGAASP